MASRTVAVDAASGGRCRVVGGVVGDRTADLVDVRAATVAMLRRPLDWRVRAVETVVIDAASTCVRRRSLQVAPLRAMLDEYLPTDGDYTHALLPMFVAPFPRGPLLDFDVEGPDGSASLLPRSEIATREVAFFEDLLRECEVDLTDDVRSVLIAALGYSGPWLHEEIVDPDEFLREGLPFEPDTETLDTWRNYSARCGSVLLQRVDTVERTAPEAPWLVLPELFANGFLVSADHASATLRSYAVLLEHLSDRAAIEGEGAAADECLEVLADYACSYDLMAVMKVPLDEPFVVKTAERRNVRMDPKRNSGHQELVIADARTNHVTIKVDDPNVRLVSADAYSVDSVHYAVGPLVSRRNDQYVAFYSHDPDRDYRIRVEFRLHLLRRLESVSVLAAVLVASLTYALWDSDDLDVRTLALLGGPAALSASVLVGREQSTLGSRLRLRSTSLLAGSLVVLVLSVCALYALRIS